MRIGRRFVATLLCVGAFTLATPLRKYFFTPPVGRLSVTTQELSIAPQGYAAAPTTSFARAAAGALSDPRGWFVAGAAAAVAASAATRSSPRERRTAAITGRLPARGESLLQLDELRGHAPFDVRLGSSLPGAALRRSPDVRMGVVEPAKFKKGLTIEFEDAIWKVLDFQQSKTARQAAVVRTKLKNLLTGTTTEKTFRLKEAVPTATLEKRLATYSYEDEGDFVLYDVETADELRLKTDSVMNGDLMTAGMEVTVLQWESTVVDLNLPSTIELEITDTQPGVAGDRANPGKKPAVVETGATVQVPLFVETGERIIVNGETRDYMGRAEK